MSAFRSQIRESASTPIASEFMVVPDELSGFPSVRESEFGIGVVSGRGTISFLLSFYPTAWHLQREHSQHSIEKLGRERLSDLVPHPGMFQCQCEKRRMKP